MHEQLFLRADWPAPEGVVAGTSVRVGGVSTGAYESLNLGGHVEDRDANVRENRSRLHALLTLPAEPAWLRQIHGTRVARLPFGDESREADASISTGGDDVCAVLTADCLPVLFTRSDGLAIAAAHAGWRGLCAGVLEATVAAFDCDPSLLMAWLGPAISQPAFEVGPEVRERFVAADSGAAACFVANAAGRWQADLYGLARRRLAGSGVTAIYGGGRCTYREAEVFFSYRREGRCGRMASLIFRAR